MANHKRRRPKNARSGCLMCKPHKANGVRKRGSVHGGARIALSRTWKQEARAALGEREQLDEQAAPWRCPVCEGDGIRQGCVWCGMPCPEGEHQWGQSDLEAPGWRRCQVCFADDFVG